MDIEPITVDRLICPLDDSPLSRRAVVPAGDLAFRLGARLTLLHAAQVTDDDSREVLTRAAMERSRGGADFVFDTERSPEAAIVAAVETWPSSIVCMSTHGRQGLRRAVLGSVTESTLRHLRVPLALVGPSYEGRPDPGSGGVIATVDGSSISEEILPVATALAVSYDARLWIVHVSDPVRPEESLGEADVANLAQLARAHCRAEAVALEGSQPAAEIAAFADGHPDALLAMSTHGHRGASRLAAGSVAMSVVHRARQPVVVIRPGSLSSD